MEGRSLGALQAALRVGARVTWQRLQEQARQGHGNPEEFARIGETVFWYMDELAASCSAGTLRPRRNSPGDEPAATAPARDARLRPGSTVARGRRPARAAGWPLPRRVAVVALAAQAASTRGPLPPDVLADLTRRNPCLLIADPDGPQRRQRLAAVLRGWLRADGRPGASQPPPEQLAAVGPAVPLAGASGSLRWAVQALALARRGLVTTGSSAEGTGADEAGVVGARTTCPLSSCWPTLTLRRPSAGGARAASAAARRPGRPAGGDTARLAGERRRRQRRRPQAPRTPADHPLPAAAGQRAVREALNDPDARFRLLLALRVRGLLGGSPGPG